LHRERKTFSTFHAILLVFMFSNFSTCVNSKGPVRDLAFSLLHCHRCAQKSSTAVDFEMDVGGQCFIQTRACERSVSGAENGAERVKNSCSGSGAVSGLLKKSRSVSGAWSGMNYPLKFRSNHLNFGLYKSQ